MTVDTATHSHDGTRYGALWAGVLGPPLASLVGLEVGYVLAERACATGQLLPLHLSFLGCLLLAVAPGVVAWREWRRWGARPASEEGGALAILAQWSASLFLHPCR